MKNRDAWEIILTLFTASQSTPRSKYFHSRGISARLLGSEKQAPLLAASPRPGMFPIAFSTFSCESPDTTNTVFRSSAHNFERAFIT
jgi:hypothetical protein